MTTQKEFHILLIILVFFTILSIYAMLLFHFLNWISDQIDLFRMWLVRRKIDKAIHERNKNALEQIKKELGE